MDRPRRSLVKRSNPSPVENIKADDTKRKKEAGKKPAKKEVIKKKVIEKEVVKKDANSDSESSSDEFVRVKSEPGPLKLKNDPMAERDFSSIEQSIFDGVTRLSESDSDSEFEEVGAIVEPPISEIKVETSEVADLAAGSSGRSKKKLQLSKLKKIAINGSDSKVEKNDELIAVKDETDAVQVDAKSNKTRKRTPRVIENGDVKKGSRKRKSVVSEELRNDTDQSDEDEKPAPAKTKAVKKVPESKDKSDRHPSKVQENSRARGKSGEAIKNRAIVKEESPKESKRKAKEGKARKNGLDKEEKSSKSLKSEPGSSTNAIPTDIDDLDMNELLALGENLGLKPVSQAGGTSDVEDSDEMEDDWEEVNEENNEQKHVIPKDGVQITLEMPELFRRRQKKKEDMQAILNRQLNRVRREFQVLFHKVSVLTWLAHGFYVNRVLNDEGLLAVALSLVPNEHCMPPSKVDLKYLKSIVAWFSRLIDYSEGFTHIDDDNSFPIRVEALERQFLRRVAKSKRDMMFMLICILRAININVRLVVSLQPMPLKPQSSDLFSIKPSTEKRGRKSLAHTESSSPSKQKQSDDIETEPKPSTSKASSSSRKSATKRKSEEPAKAPSPRKTRSGAVRKSYKEETADSDTDSKQTEERKTSGSKVDAEKTKNNEPLLSPKRKSLSEEEKEQLRLAAEKRIPSRRRFAAAVVKKKDDRKKKDDKKKKDDEDFDPKELKSDSEDGDSDFTPESRMKTKMKRESPKEEPKKGSAKKSKTPVVNRGRKSGSGKGRKVLSSSDDDKLCGKPKKMGLDYWLEVYVHKEESWIPVDATRGKVDCGDEIKARATQPIIYVVAWNRDNTVKDVTRRYVSQYSQVTVKQRAEDRWWEKTLKPFRPKSSAAEREEESQLHMAQLNRPMPKSVAECKNHPLYALKRHLLKFEAIYPPDSPTLGFVRGEPLYARANVYTLHSREIWIKEAKTVKLGEKPYKIVKARPKYDRMSGTTITDLPLEIFGPWQVEDYVPPTAENGIVPRNAYGNVELFKPCMLPKGCVHLQLPSLNRIARKLQIDCAPAVVGFDYHCGGSHPTFDGYVVCEEYVDLLMDAWNREIDESAKRQKEKDEKRIYGNWRRLIRGLIIREHLKIRYDFNEDDPDNAPADTRRSEIAAAEARLNQPTAKIQSVFPTLLAKVRSGRSRKSTAPSGPSSSKSKKAPVAKNPKGNPGRRKKKQETSSEEEEESDVESTTTEDEGDMVLLSDEDSGSEFGDVE